MLTSDLVCELPTEPRFPVLACCLCLQTVSARGEALPATNDRWGASPVQVFASETPFLLSESLPAELDSSSSLLAMISAREREIGAADASPGVLQVCPETLWLVSLDSFSPGRRKFLGCPDSHGEIPGCSICFC